VPQRGAWLGNRGCIHNAKREILKPYSLKRWIICELEFQGWHREVMLPGKYTELFFLDEATALSAGHRPCNWCRREDAQSFLAKTGFTRLAALDEALHEQRMAPKTTVDWRGLPDGAMAAQSGIPVLVKEGRLFRWSFDGYTPFEPESNQALLLTPAITVGALEKGYCPRDL
jgi:hypothetical protein